MEVNPLDKGSPEMGCQEISQAVNDFLAQISKERRLIFLRRYWFLEAEEQIVKRYNTTLARVNAQLFFARLQLRRTLRNHGCHVVKAKEIFEALMDVEPQYITEAEYDSY